MLDALTEGLVLLDRQGRIVDWNAAALVTLGLSADELSGRTPMDPRWQAIHPDGTPWPGELHPSTLAATTGRTIPEQLMGIRRPSGELVWIQVNARPLRPGSGDTDGALAAFFDVTARVESNKLSHERSHRLQTAMDHGAVGIALTDPAGRITYSNKKFDQIVDATPERTVGSRLTELLHRHDPSVPLLRELEDGGEVDFHGEVQLQIGDAATRWIELHVSTLPDVEGIAAHLVQITDISARHELEMQFRRSEELSRISLDSLDQGVIFASPTLGIQRMNPAATAILGYTADELYELWLSPTWSMLDENAEPIHAAEFAGMRAIETAEAVRDQILWLLHRDRTWKRVRMSAVPFGWTDEVVLFFSDITAYTADHAPRPDPAGFALRTSE